MYLGLYIFTYVISRTLVTYVGYRYYPETSGEANSLQKYHQIITHGSLPTKANENMYINTAFSSHAHPAEDTMMTSITQTVSFCVVHFDGAHGQICKRGNYTYFDQRLTKNHP